MAVIGFSVHTNHIPAQWQCRQNNGTNHYNMVYKTLHKLWSSESQPLRRPTNLHFGWYRCHRNTTLLEAHCYIALQPISLKSTTSKCSTTTGLDNCKGIHNSPRISKSVKHGHLPSLLGKLACTCACARVRTRTHTHKHTPVQKHEA